MTKTMDKLTYVSPLSRPVYLSGGSYLCECSARGTLQNYYMEEEQPWD